MPASACTTGCSAPGSGRGRAPLVAQRTRADQRGSTTRSRSVTASASAPRSWAPTSSAPGLAGRSGLEGLVGAVTVFNATGASWDWASFYALTIGVEVLLLAFILRAAWTWPRAASPSMPDLVEPNRSQIQMGR